MGLILFLYKLYSATEFTTHRSMIRCMLEQESVNVSPLFVCLDVGSGSTQVYHASVSHTPGIQTPGIHAPGRLLSVKSRQDVDTEALISQLPSPIRKAKFGSKLVMSYDNRHLIETPSSDFIQNQLHDFDAKVAGFEEEEVTEEGHEQEEVFSDEEDGAAEPGRERRSSLVLSAAAAIAALPQLSQFSRSSSLPSLSLRGGRQGRAKSEILYFAYTESGKDKLNF